MLYKRSHGNEKPERRNKAQCSHKQSKQNSTAWYHNLVIWFKFYKVFKVCLWPQGKGSPEVLAPGKDMSSGTQR